MNLELTIGIELPTNFYAKLLLPQTETPPMGKDMAALTAETSERNLNGPRLKIHDTDYCSWFCVDK